VGEVIRLSDFSVPRDDRILAEAVEAQRQVAEQALVVASVEYRKLHEMDPSTCGK
jgi:hypothetical protein